MNSLEVFLNLIWALLNINHSFGNAIMHLTLQKKRVKWTLALQRLGSNRWNGHPFQRLFGWPLKRKWRSTFFFFPNKTGHMHGSNRWSARVTSLFSNKKKLNNFLTVLTFSPTVHFSGWNRWNEPLEWGLKRSENSHATLGLYIYAYIYLQWG